MHPELSFSFYILDVIFRRILRQNAEVRWPVHFTSTIRCGHKLKRGKDCRPGDSPNVYINAMNGVELGDYTNIGPGVSIISANHNPTDNRKHLPAAPVRIGRHCWLGAGAAILPEVVLGDFTIVGAGAVVTRSFPAGYCVVAGNPARIIKSLNKESCLSVAQENHI